MIPGNINVLKFVYRALLTGLPIVTYNPITKVNFLAPLVVAPYSTYLNFKLNVTQTSYIKQYLNNFNSDLEIVPISMIPEEEPSNYLSVNIYNCTSPAFMSDKEISRCEINAYVKDKKGNYGTLIIDYLCNDLSMDPVNIFKVPSNIDFKMNDIYNCINCHSKLDQVNLKLNYTQFQDIEFEINDDLIKYTDNVYYKNGIIDKVYYDNSLVNPELRSPSLFFNFTFNYRDLQFDKIDSIFYFKNPLKFVGSMWDNIYNIE